MNLLRDVVVPQLAKPHGWLAAPVLRLLNRGNRLITAHTIGALDLEESDSVLEIGFGGGVGLSLVQSHVPRASLRGVDISEDVVARARRAFPGLDLRTATSDALPFDTEFDAVFAVNVAYFWRDVPAALGELRRVLRAGGRLALGVRPASTCAQLEFARSGHREWEPQRYADAMTDAGFTSVRARRMPDPGGGAHVVLGAR